MHAASSENEECMASPNSSTNVETIDESSDSDEIEIIQELKVTPTVHSCDLCCKGTFLVSKLLNFAGVNCKYTCEICFENFKTRSKAQKHAKTHELPPLLDSSESPSMISYAGNSNWICNLCSHPCKSEVGLKRHTTNQHRVPLTCWCGLTYRSERKFKEHLSAHRTAQKSNPPVSLISCPSCHKSFAYEKSFKEHVCSLVAL